MHDYHYVYHKETDEQAFRLQEGPFEGVVWIYRDVKLPIHDEDGNRLDLEEVDTIPLTFRYDVLYNKDGVVNEETLDEFNKVVKMLRCSRCKKAWYQSRSDSYFSASDK